MGEVHVSNPGVGFEGPCVGLKNLGRKSLEESKVTWYIAGPAILATVFQFSISIVTVVFVGRLGSTELAAVSIVQNVIEGFAFGVMLGMGSALETLCGQAVGAGQFHMLGIYMQRSWIITCVTAMVLSPLYVFSSPILKLFHQSDEIAQMSGKYSIWVIPQLFAYAINFPLQKFLQSQSKVMVLTAISGVTLMVHVLLNWVFVTKLNYGLTGAAVVGNISWWIINLAQIIYLVSGFFPESWTGLSWLAFHSLFAFVKLSLASAIMLCLELWYFTAIILLVGGLHNAEIAIDAISICMNLELWTLMVALGFNAAVSVRVSNELGAGRPKAARFSVIVNVTTSAMFGILFMVIILTTKNDFPKLFATDPMVIKATSKLGTLLAFTIFLNSIQPVLSGVAVGAGWQTLVAFVNVGCYYLFGLPIGALLGYKFKLGVKGIWSGMVVGCVLQTLILIFITIRTNWEKEACQAKDRIRTWGGTTGPRESSGS
ncbi:hypothetical protein AMTRI_Chr13g125340 [Amborella trichopoda]|uniref:Protein DETOXIFICATION n=1 Tax=Amborella trichopoda TaxID=13333 RepID=U5D5A8_AMBTC|nr:protein DETOXIFICATION 33 [Amborella trichopoda]ERN17619.1 hypothetical protein AMTR_s00059p00169820 [Amborella trichopoda]|eukprot:XP_006856152.1 protein DETOXIFICATION 33 [Amborella trichopoda]